MLDEMYCVGKMHENKTKHLMHLWNKTNKRIYNKNAKMALKIKDMMFLTLMYYIV